MATSTKEPYMAPELRIERERSKLNVEELTNYLDGGEPLTERRREMQKIILDDPVFDQEDYPFLTTEEAFSRSMEKGAHYLIMLRDMEATAKLDRYYMEEAINEDMPIDLHESMFTPSINNQGTEEQQEKWMPMAKDYNIIGAYAQTELGHGTFIRGLETTATYDPSTQEFILNSPTLTSLKWWPGGLGHCATHAVVVARLITKGVDHGIHLFIVQLRSLEDHKPLPGIRVGDIGPKFGYKGMDNGFMELTNVRIPRDHMLMKYAKVSPDGTYFKPPTDKISYGTMVLIRAGMCVVVSKALARAVTIATRYSVVRRQTENYPGQPETQVMDYQTQQYKVLPLIATAYALLAAGQAMFKMFVAMTAEISEGNFESLPEIHASTSGLKALTTEVCSQGIELCRLSCGGHGYSLASGIPDIYVRYTPAQTYEGENTVLLLQTARYLHKMYNRRQQQTDLPSNISYLAVDYHKQLRSVATTAQQFSDLHILMEAYRQRARRLIEIASARYQDGVRAGMDGVAAWNNSSVDWTVAAKAHCHYVVLKSFNESVQAADVCDSNAHILRTLCCLYGVFGIVQYAGEFGLDGYMTTDQLLLARQHLYTLLKIVRPEAVPLVDAFDIHDKILNSALGRYDGDVYRHLYEWALKAPRNKSEVHETYHKYLRDLIKKTKSKL